MTNAWQEYKKKLGDSRPWDLLNPNQPKASDEEAESRLNICKSCEHLMSITSQCKKCGCVMPAKVKIQRASCPINKW
jgi:hypothetical protein